MHPLVHAAEIARRVNELIGKRFSDVKVRIVDLDFYIWVTRQRLQKDSIIFDQEIVEIQAPVDRWPKELMWIPALLLFALIVLAQRRRRPPETTEATA